MTMLFAGVLLWVAVHLFPVFMTKARAGLIARFGDNAYRGVFSLLLLGAIALMVFGWRSIDGEQVQQTAYWMCHVTYVLVLVAVILFAAAKGRSRVLQVVRHPLLSGAAVWAIGHLLVNHEPRSWVLFGGILAWTLISIVGINRRDGAYDPPQPWSWGREMRLIAISGVVYLVLLFGHPYISGVALF